MISYKDRTYCNNSNCTCDRKLTQEDKDSAKRMGLPISFGNLCQEKDPMYKDRPTEFTYVPGPMPV